MANMKLVGTQWDGACVIACDCGSEEPVTGTVTLGRKEWEVETLERHERHSDEVVNLRGKEIDRLEREVTRSRSIENDTQEEIFQAERYIEQLERERYNLRRERDRLVHKDTILRYEIGRVVDTAESPIDDDLFDRPEEHFFRMTPMEVSDFEVRPWPWQPPGNPAEGKSKDVTDD